MGLLTVRVWMSLTLLSTHGVHFPSTGLPQPALIEVFVSSIIVSCYAMFAGYPTEACSSEDIINK